MATIAEAPARRAPVSIAPTPYERLLAIAALALLVAVAAALARGYPEWRRVPWDVWPHLLTIVVALVLTPVMLLRRRGDAAHRLLGKIWVAAMLATALLSFNIRAINHGGGVYTRYAHLAGFDYNVDVGDDVAMGQQIGLMGNTSDNPIPIHLHYEILTGNYDTPKKSFVLTPVNPLSLMMLP